VYIVIRQDFTLTQGRPTRLGRRMSLPTKLSLKYFILRQTTSLLFFHHILLCLRKRCGFCPTDLLTFDDLLGQADTRLFSKIGANDQHVLHQLLSPQTTASQNYSLRERSHQFQLPERSGCLSDSNCVNGICYTKTYTCLLTTPRVT